jgi:hypothetical protein
MVVMSQHSLFLFSLMVNATFAGNDLSHTSLGIVPERKCLRARAKDAFRELRFRADRLARLRGMS